MIRKRKTKLKTGKTKTFYQAIVYFKGKVVSRKSFETKAAAIIYESETLKKCKLGKRGFSKGYTFGMCMEDYLKSDFLLQAESTRQTRKIRFIYLKEAPIYDCFMEEFSDHTIDDWLDWLYAHKTIKNKHRKNFLQELSLLSTILSWYRENRDSTFVPPILKRHRKKCCFKKVPKRVPNYYIDPKDICTWLEYLKANMPDIVYYRMGLFMILTGCRLGETAGLCWDAVHLDCERPFVQIIRTMTWYTQKRTAKFQENVKTQESFRTINLPNILVEEFKKIKKLKISDRYPVFYSSNTNNTLHSETIRNNFNKAFKALDLPWRGCHITRHTSGTLALLAGKDLSIVQAMLGHKNISQTQQYAKIVALQNNSAPHVMADFLGLK